MVRVLEGIFEVGMDDGNYVCRNGIEEATYGNYVIWV
jgi:hypothetical protein